MTHTTVIEIVYSPRQHFDFIVHAKHDNLIVGDEADLRRVLQMLINRLDAHEYPFAFFLKEADNNGHV